MVLVFLHDNNWEVEQPMISVWEKEGLQSLSLLAVVVKLISFVPPVLTSGLQMI